MENLKISNSSYRLVLVLLSAVMMLMLFLPWGEIGNGEAFIKGNVKPMDILESCTAYKEWARSENGFHSAYFSGLSDMEKIERLETFYRQYSRQESVMGASLLFSVIGAVSGSVLHLLKKKIGGYFSLVCGLAGLALPLTVSAFIGLAEINGSATIAYYLYFLLSICVFVVSFLYVNPIPLIAGLFKKEQTGSRGASTTQTKPIQCPACGAIMTRAYLQANQNAGKIECPKCKTQIFLTT